MSATVLRIPRALALFWVGAGLGLLLAVGTLAAPVTATSRRNLPSGAVAAVNGQLVLDADYQGALRDLRVAQGRPTSPREEQAVLERLIDDELMVEEGLKLDMARRDLATRTALLGAVSAAERAAAADEAPTDEELERFYRDIRGDLARPRGMRLRLLAIRARDRLEEEAARARAELAVRRLRSGEPFESVRSDLATPAEDTLPDAPLSAGDLRQRLGALLFERVVALEPGQVSDVIGVDRVFRVVQVIEKQPLEVPSFEEARAAVQARYERKRGEDFLAAKLAELRAAADVRTSNVRP